jgi:hypothetical protein
MHQQALTAGHFDNTYKEDTISPEVEIGGCRTQVSTARGNEKWTQNTNTQQPSYSLYPLSLLHELYLRSDTMVQ